LKWIPGLRFCFDLLVTLGYIFALRRNIAAFVGYQTLGAGIHAVIAGRLFKVPSLVLIRSEREYQDDLRNPIKRQLSRFTWSAAGRILFQAPRMRSDFLSSAAAGEVTSGALADRTGIVPNGADALMIHEAPDRTDRLILIARLDPEKGVGIALQALRDMAAGERPELLVIGDGPLLADFRTAAQGLTVTFTGDVPHADVISYLEGGGLFVLPSLQEGMPNALIEAMACGLPVVATSVGGVPDLIRHAENGLLVAPGNPHALREAIACLRADAVLRQRLRNAGRSTAAAFSWEALGQRLICEVASVRGQVLRLDA
jgi:glycosyltransferase involved in cell wall biosynthesis